MKKCVRCDIQHAGELDVCFSCMPWAVSHWYSPRQAARCNIYRITTDQFIQMYIVQEGRCGICQIKKDDFHIDHDHETGKIRGLLCSNCNTGLGRLGDTYSGVERALHYLTNEEFGCQPAPPPPPPKPFKKQSERRGPSKKMKQRRRRKHQERCLIHDK